MYLSVHKPGFNTHEYGTKLYRWYKLCYVIILATYICKYVIQIDENILPYLMEKKFW